MKVADLPEQTKPDENYPYQAHTLYTRNCEIRRKRKNNRKLKLRV